MSKIKVLFFTTTLLLTGLSWAKAQKFDREINSVLFVPKGNWLAGGSISYSDYNLRDMDILIVSKANLDGYNLSISPFFGYTFKDNLAAGARFGYKRTLVSADNIDIDLGDDLSFEIKDYYNLQHMYYGTAMLRSYMSLGRSKRMGLFNEVRFTLGGGQGKVVSGKGDEVSGSYQNIFEVQVGLSPGLIAFITNSVAIEASVGILGYQYRNVKQTRDQVYEGALSRNSANFKVDLFSINIGCAFYISR